jgi:hypothetical protein
MNDNNTTNNNTNDNNTVNNIISCDEFGDFYYYTCNISKSFIIFEKNIKNSSISINNTDFKWNEPKLVLNLLNYSFNDIIPKLKNLNINYFVYTVMKDDLTFLDMTKWNILTDDNITVDLQCNLDECFENVIKGFIQNQ